jgi:catechol 2,3-dioxygenase-like lactoylglutathione lyase family enzyme
MKIIELTIFTNKLKEQMDFYSKTLGFKVISKNNFEFEVQIGYSKLKFKKSEIDFKYHYCFLIPSNLLIEAIGWIKKRTNLIEIENGVFTQNFESWNADSIYFYDGGGNLAEFIVRKDLKNDDNGIFDISKILCVNEIGMPTNDISKINSQLENEMNSMFWRGDKERFGTNGTQDGLFLLVNNLKKDTWYPTEVRTQSSPFEAKVKIADKLYFIEFTDEILIKKAINGRFCEIAL